MGQQREQKSKIIIIAGPTAVGKTNVGVAVCKQLNGEIVGCDSMQIYRGMDIGTAKATSEELDGVVHHLISYVEPSENYSVAQYQEDAINVIEKILSRGKVPVLVGGTGLYINAVLYPMTFLDYDPSIRKAIEEEYLTVGNQAMYDKLVSLSPQMAAKLSPNDVKRVTRALELVAMGKEHHTADKQKEPRYDFDMYVLQLERALLYDRINARVDLMLEQGLVQEVRTLLCSGVAASSQSFQAIAYKEIAAYLAGEMPLNETIDLIKQRSRNYAKRQLTWFRGNREAIWLDALQDNTATIVDRWRNK